jgi:hypothetical protein
MPVSVRATHTELLYRLRTSESVKFDQAVPVTRETPWFRMRLADGALTVEMKEHYTNEAGARACVDPDLKAWELDVGLRLRPKAIAFEFDKAEIIDRNPPGPGEPHILEASAGSFLFTGGSATFSVTYRQYPVPPSNLKVTPDVESLWFRYKMHIDGKEPLLSMAYFCLSLLEGTTGQKHGARETVCQMCRIDRAVRDKLGDLVSERGGPLEARKLDSGATRTPLNASEKQWILEVIRALIRRKAEYDFDSNRNFSHIAMSDFIAL